MSNVRSFARFAVLPLAVVLVAASWCEAQEREGRQRGRRPGGAFAGRDASPAALIQREQVQEALNLTDEQKEQVGELQTSLRGDREAFGRLRELPEEERREAFAKLREEREQRASEADEKLKNVLTSEQYKRLREISIQVRGSQALLAEDVAADLNLTDNQRREIRNILGAHREKMQELRGGEREAVRRQMAELRQETDAQVLDVLNQQQRQKYEELKGEEIELERRGRRPGGRRPQGQRRERP